MARWQAAAGFFLKQRPNCRLDEKHVSAIFPLLDKMKKSKKGTIKLDMEALKFVEA